MEKKTYNVLVVDDDDSLRKKAPGFIGLIFNGLDFLGGKTVLAANPRKAFSEIDATEDKESPFDFVLCDLHCDPVLPDEKSGFKIVRHAKKMMPGCIVIMMTSQVVDDNLEADATEAGADLLLEKPIDLQELSSSLRILMDMDGRVS